MRPPMHSLTPPCPPPSTHAPYFWHTGQLHNSYFLPLNICLPAASLQRPLPFPPGMQEGGLNGAYLDGAESPGELTPPSGNLPRPSVECQKQLKPVPGGLRRSSLADQPFEVDAPQQRPEEVAVAKIAESSEWTRSKVRLGGVEGGKGGDGEGVGEGKGSRRGREEGKEEGGKGREGKCEGKGREGKWDRKRREGKRERREGKRERKRREGKGRGRGKGGKGRGRGKGGEGKERAGWE